MGIHSGPVSGVVDVNERANLTGAGINIAKRVMGCGDAGTFLLSKHVAEDLEEYEEWRPMLHDLGACEVKHGMHVAIVNLWSDDLGNRQLPQKFQAFKKHRARVRWAEVATALLLLDGDRRRFRSRFEEISKIDINCSGKKYRGPAFSKLKQRSR